MVIVAITGAKRSGKDTCAKYLVENHGFLHVSLARPLKDWLMRVDPVLTLPKNIRLLLHYFLIIFTKFKIPRYSDFLKKFDPDILKDEFPIIRTFLQETGSNLVREIDPDFWVNNLIKHMTCVDGKYVISDVRFDNEVALLKKHFDSVVVIKINRNTGYYDSHYSENGISYSLVDYLIINDSDFNSLYLSLRAILKLNE